MNDNREHDPGGGAVRCCCCWAGAGFPRAYFPTANPPVTKIEEGKQVAAAAAAGRARPPTRRRRSATATQVLRETAARARSDRDARASPARSTCAAPGSTTSPSPPSARRSTGTRRRSGSSRPRAPAIPISASSAGPAPEGAVPTATTLWQRRGDRLTPGQPGHALVGQWPGPAVRDRPLGRRQLHVPRRAADRSTAAPRRFTARPYSPVSRRGGLRDRDVDGWTVHVGPMGVFDGAADYDNDFSTVAEAPGGRIERPSTGGWIGFTDTYWLAAVIPAQGAQVAAEFRHVAATDRYQASYRRPGGQRRAGHGGGLHLAPLRRRQGSRAARRLFRRSSARRSSRRSTGAGSNGS